MLSVILNVIQAIHHMPSRIIFSSPCEAAYFVLFPFLFVFFCVFLVFTLRLDVIRSIYIHIRYFWVLWGLFGLLWLSLYFIDRRRSKKLFMRLFISKIRVIRGIVMENERWNNQLDYRCRFDWLHMFATCFSLKVFAHFASSVWLHDNLKLLFLMGTRMMAFARK